MTRRSLRLGSALLVLVASLSACSQGEELEAAAEAPAEEAGPPPLPSPFGEPYELVAAWPTFPEGMFFGTKEGFPTQAERDAAAAARRAQQATAQSQGGQGQGAPADGAPEQPPIFGQGVSGIAIDDQDNIYVFNRGVQTILVFDRDGKFVRGGGEQDAKGQKVAGGWLHSGEVDWQGNVWVVERDNQRILKYAPTLDRVLLELGTAGVTGTDATHFDQPSGISVLRNGNLVVTDGYGNNRLLLFSPEGKLIKQVAKGAGGPDDAGTGPGEFDLPHQAAVDANDNLYVIDRENHRIQVFDADLNYQREIAHPGWYPWDIAISRKGDDGFAYIADHAGERVHKISLADGAILATWGQPGRGPSEFDWVHGMAVDTRGAVYAADTYGQRVQKFVPAAQRTTTP
jgi:DNA-binding beta-propeller fold protein YncE